MLANVYNKISDAVANTRLTINARQLGVVNTAVLLGSEFTKAAVGSGLGKVVGAFAEQGMINAVAGNPALEYVLGTTVPVASALLNATSTYSIANNTAKYYGVGDRVAKGLSVTSAILAGAASLHPMAGALNSSAAMARLAGAQLSNIVSSFTRESFNESINGIAPRLDQDATLISVSVNALEHGGMSVLDNVELAGAVHVSDRGVNKIEASTPDFERPLKNTILSSHATQENNWVGKGLLNGFTSGAENVSGALAKMASCKDLRIERGKGWIAEHELSVDGALGSAKRIATKATSRMVVSNMSTGLANTVGLFTGMSEKNAQRIGQALQLQNPFRSAAVQVAAEAVKGKRHNGPPEVADLEEIIEHSWDDDSIHSGVNSISEAGNAEQNNMVEGSPSRCHAEDDRISMELPLTPNSEILEVSYQALQTPVVADTANGKRCNDQPVVADPEEVVKHSRDNDSTHSSIDSASDAGDEKQSNIVEG